MVAPMLASKIRILYSEDDPDARELMCLVLEGEGFEVACPETSEAVLIAAKEEGFDAIVLDNWTPGLSGIDLCKRIREFDHQTPIVFYSAAVFERDKEEARAAGAQAYISKPTSPEELVGTIRSLITCSRQSAS